MPSIEVTAILEGLHCWPDAPEKVEFLRHPHRHQFIISVTLSVNGSDREVEFFLLKSDLQAWLSSYPGYRGHARLKDLGTRSCEHIAEEVHTYLTNIRYSVHNVKVSEDGECAGVWP